jgi:hypothetical protein
LRPEELDLLPIEKQMAAAGCVIAFESVQDLPHAVIKDFENLDKHYPRLFDDPRVAVLKKGDPSQKPGPAVSEILQHCVPTAREAAPAQ